MKILFDLTPLNDNFSGIERFALNISKNIIENDNTHNYILVFKNELHSDFINISKKSNVKIIILYGKNKLIFSQITILKTLYKEKADYYLFLSFPAPLLFFNRNSISAIHDIGCWDCPKAMTTKSVIYFRILYWKATRLDKKIITVSNFSKKRIMEKLNVTENNIIVVYNGISDTFKKDILITNNIFNKYNIPKNYLLCLATLEPRKNLKLLIEAYNELINEQELNFPLVLAGRKGWKIDDLLQNISDKTKNNIYFTGFVDDEDLPLLYKNCQLFIFPSLYEGFGIPPLEALYMGKKVLVSNLEVFHEVFQDNVYYFKSNDIASLKKSINNILSNKVSEKKIDINHFKYLDWSIQGLKLLNYLSK